MLKKEIWTDVNNFFRCEEIFHKLSQLINEIDEMDKKIEMMEQCQTTRLLKFRLHSILGATARTARSRGKQSLNAFIGMQNYEK